VPEPELRLVSPSGPWRALRADGADGAADSRIWRGFGFGPLGPGAAQLELVQPGVGVLVRFPLPAGGAPQEPVAVEGNWWAGLERVRLRERSGAPIQIQGAQSQAAQVAGAAAQVHPALELLLPRDLPDAHVFVVRTPGARSVAVTAGELRAATAREWSFEAQPRTAVQLVLGDEAASEAAAHAGFELSLRLMPDDGRASGRMGQVESSPHPLATDWVHVPPGGAAIELELDFDGPALLEWQWAQGVPTRLGPAPRQGAWRSIERSIEVVSPVTDEHGVLRVELPSECWTMLPRRRFDWMARE
jgi:hypothetical protein